MAQTSATSDASIYPPLRLNIKERSHLSQPDSDSPSILDRLAQGAVLVSDGAVGTYLLDYGQTPGRVPEEANDTRPELVRTMAAEYFSAGADMVLTNTFGGNKFVLGKHGLGGRVNEINRLAVTHARAVAPPGRYVVGTMGPSGVFLHPMGAVSEDEMLDAFTEQSIALAEGGADAVIVEAMYSLQEALLGVEAAKENTDLPVVATMAFDRGQRGFFTMMGDRPDGALQALRDAGADIVGANCGNGFEAMVELAAQIRGLTDGYLITQSNAGMPQVSGRTVTYTDTPADMAQHFAALPGLGINIIGGCCGTTPDHIRALRRSVDESLLSS